MQITPDKTKKGSKHTLLARLRNRKTYLMAGSALLCAAFTTFLIPQPVYATPGTDIWSPDTWGNNILRLIEGIFLNLACGFFSLYSAIVGDIKGSTGLTAAFSSILGNNMYSLTETVHQSAVIPIGHAILGLFMLVQLIKISQRIDATSTLPAVKEIVFLVVTYCIMSWLIDNSLQIVSAIYDLVVTNIVPHIDAAGDASSGISTITIDDFDLDTVTTAGAFTTFICSILTVLVGFIAYIVAFVVAYARAWQIYVYAAFSPIPMALLGFDETKQIGIGFLKNICAACLAGAIMLFVLVAYPYLVTSLSLQTSNEALVSIAYLGATTGQAPAITAVMTAIEGILISAGTGILLCYSLIKSGAWAKEILGA